MTTLTDLLPVRLGIFDRSPRPARKHRAPDEIDRLRHKLAGAELLMAGYRIQLDDKDRALDDTAAKQAEAEELVVKQQADIDDLTDERDMWRDEALRLRAKFGPQLAAEANAHRITVPPMQRIGADQDTDAIDVTTLWAARDAGHLGPVTDPGRIR
ncbi:hypothetical protein AB5J49_08215 [Streptomyces sp. R28]|uniref:Uncharacterized protein n=1 Tax=Streptomyces sp. R28 TaxID=3238628 RepID=A0AB39PSM6_9ACTN